MTGDVILEDCSDYNAGQELQAFEKDGFTVFYQEENPVAWLRSTEACTLLEWQ